MCVPSTAIERLDVARQRRIEDLLVLAARLIAREILHAERQHPVAQALIVHHAVEMQKPARIAARDQREMEVAIIFFELVRMPGRVLSTTSSSTFESL